MTELKRLELYRSTCAYPSAPADGYTGGSYVYWAKDVDAALAARDRRIAELEAEVKRVRGLIALDRTGLAAGLAAVRRIVAGYGWIPAGEWGLYSCDEQTEEALRREVGDAFDEIANAVHDSLRASGDRADVAFRPELEPKRLLERTAGLERDLVTAINQANAETERAEGLEERIEELEAERDAAMREAVERVFLAQSGEEGDDMCRDEIAKQLFSGSGARGVYLSPGVTRSGSR